MCDKCGSHFRLSVWQRLQVTVDPDSFSAWDEDLPLTDPLGFPDYLGYGWYRQRFPIPAGFGKGPHAYLLFGATDEDAEVWLNGRKAFEHTCASTGLAPTEIWIEPFLFDPRPFLNPGRENVIAVRILNTANAGGIWKPVYLVSAGEASTPRLIWAAIQASRKRARRAGTGARA